MVRTQVQLEEGQHEAVRTLAHRERISMSEVIRRFIDMGLGRSESSQRGAAALLELAGIGQSGLPDIAQRHDDYLDEDYAADSSE